MWLYGKNTVVLTCFGSEILNALGTTTDERLEAIRKIGNAVRSFQNVTRYYELAQAGPDVGAAEVIVYIGFIQVVRRTVTTMQEIHAIIADETEREIEDFFQGGWSIEQIENTLDDAWVSIRDNSLGNASHQLNRAYFHAVVMDSPVLAVHALSDYLGIYLQSIGSDKFAEQLLYAARDQFNQAHERDLWPHDLYRAQIAYNLGVMASTLGEDFDELALLRLAQSYMAGAIKRSSEYLELHIAALLATADLSVKLGEYDLASNSLLAAKELIQIGGVTPAERYLLEDISNLQQTIHGHYCVHGNCQCGREGPVPKEAKSLYSVISSNLGKLMWLGADIVANAVASIFTRRPIKGIRLQLIFGRVFKGVQVGQGNTQIIQNNHYDVGLRQMVKNIYERIGG